MHDHRVLFDLSHFVFAKPQRLPVGTTRLIEQSKVVGIKDAALSVCMVELHPRVIPKTFRSRHASLPHPSVPASGHEYRKNKATFHAVLPARVRPPPATLLPLMLRSARIPSAARPAGALARGAETPRALGRHSPAAPTRSGSATWPAASRRRAAAQRTAQLSPAQ